MQLNSTVARNVMAWVGDVNLEEKGKVNGTMTLFAGNAELNGDVAGDVLAFLGDLQINGLLGHNAWIHAGHLSIGPKAEIKGETKVEARHEPEVSTTAKLGSPIEVTILKHKSDTSYSSPGFYWHQILLWGTSFIFGLGMLLLMPGFFFDAAGACKRTMPAIGFGALFLIALPILAVIICITIVGIGVGIAALMFWAISIYAAQVIVGTWLGDRLLGEAVGFGAGLGRMALGLLILRAIGVIPYVGVWFSSLVICLGLGPPC